MREAGVCTSPPGEGRFAQPPGRLAMVKPQRILRHERGRIRQPVGSRVWRPTDGLIACPASRDRPRADAVPPLYTDLIPPSRGRKDADHKSGGPRYVLRFRRDQEV